jgi:DNA helicase-2/ATP-dependent DNA helicase PcrA
MNAFDFDDLIMGTVRLLRDRPRVLASYADRFEHVLVDEYQDTSHAQYELVNLLSGKHRNILVVGDDDQSIYGWRGADISNILDFEKDHPDATVVTLEQNYRSTSGILDAAHDVVSRNVRRKEKKLWTDRGGGAPVRLLRVANEYQEADAIRDTVGALMDEAGLAARDVAVLYRTHAQSRVIEDSLRRAAIPYDIVGGVRFYERAEVKDVLAYLRVVANPDDGVSLARIINVPPRKLGAKSLERLEAFAAEEGIPLRVALGRSDEVEGLTPQARRSLEALDGMFTRLRARMDELPADALIREVLEASGYTSWLEGQRSDEAAERLANVEELVSAAAEFAEASERSDLPAFLEQVALVANIDMWEDRLDAVSLMTLHNAKGLEFPAVIIPGLEEGLLPHESSFGDEEELAEERRLLYVGMTRAKDHLVLAAADTRRRAGVLDVRAGSRFLDDIAPDRLETPAAGVRAPARSRGARRPRPAGARGRPRGDVFPDYENASQEVVELRPGTRVHHNTWGEGVVLEVAGFGGDAVVRVRFAGDVEKRIMLRYGGLRILGE